MLVRRTAHSNGVQGRVEFKIIIAMFLILLIQSASGAISLDITAPESIREGELLTVSFTATSNISSNLSQFIFRDGNLVASSNSYQWQTTVNDSGTYLFKFLANSTNNETNEETKVIEVLDSPNLVTILTPVSDVLSNPQIRIAAITSEPANSCSYILDGVPTGSLSFDGSEWIKILVLSQDKSYNITVECIISPDVSRESVLFILDSTPPSILSKSPDGNYAGNPVPIEVETNENSFCKYDTSDVPFDLMGSEFTQTGGTDHKQITGIKTQGDITYYVACKDRHGNKMTSSEEITFYANLQPSAEVSISGGNKKADLLKSGTYEVKVETSEPILSPSLSYKFSESGTKQDIALEGEDTIWEGFFVIPEGEVNDIGTFNFDAKDLTELSGTEITKGKIFLVDTTPPGNIADFELTVEGISVKIKWLYEGEATDNFVIYRATDSEVDMLDKWDETVQEEYLDNTVLLGEQYYYRVAAVDRAGNIGPLSDAKGIIVEAKKTTENLDPNVIKKLNSTQEIFRANIFDIELALSRLEAETDPSKVELIRQLNLVDNARQAKNTLETLMKEIDKLKLISLTATEASNRIDVFLSSAQTQLRKVAQSISLIDSTRQDQILREEDLDEMINEVLVGIKLSEENRQKYIQEMKSLQNKVSVTLEAITAQIYYTDRLNAEDITLIHKKIITDQIEEAVIVESIPNEISRRSSDVIFKEQPTILRPDLMVKWESSQLTSKDIYYYVQKIVDISDVRAAKTAVVMKPKIENVENIITGDAVKEPEKNNESLINQIMVFLGFLAVISLFVYYVSYVRKTNVRQKHTIISKQQIAKKITPAHHIHRSLKQGHAYIDNINYQEALSIYKQILQQLEKEKIDDRHRKQLESTARKLYKKLMIIHHIEIGHNSIDSKNNEKLKNTAIELAKAYKELTKETELAKHTRKNHSYFLMHLKKQDRDDFFNNLNL